MCRSLTIRVYHEQLNPSNHEQLNPGKAIWPTLKPKPTTPPDLLWAANPRMIYLENKRLDDPAYNSGDTRVADIRSIVYIIRSTVENTQLVAAQVKSRPKYVHGWSTRHTHWARGAPRGMLNPEAKPLPPSVIPAASLLLLHGIANLLSNPLQSALHLSHVQMHLNLN